MEAIVDMKTAVFKIVDGDAGAYKNPDAVENVIRYIFREDARKKDNIWGSVGTYNKSIEGVIEDFQKMKRLHHKEDGVQIKHMILSFGERPDLPKKKIKKLLLQTIIFWGKDYQMVYAVHEDKGLDKYHVHIALNSVSNDGKKVSIRNKDLKNFRKNFNRIWNKYGYEMTMERT